MAQRAIPEAAVVAVLNDPTMTWHDPSEGSMALSGVDESGRPLIVWVVGDRWPATGTLRIKSTAWRDDS